MNINLLIFSNQYRYRFARHGMFWGAWILYYSIYGAFDWIKYYSFTKSFFSSLLEVSVSTPLDMAFCYSIIYFLFPKFLYKGRYVIMVPLWLLFSIIFIVLFECYELKVVPIMRGWYNMPAPKYPESFTWIFFSLFSQINMEGCLAAAIKLGKLWHIKQQELDLIQNEKVKIGPFIEEGQIQPVFFADMLNRIEVLVNEKPLLAAGMIKKIKNLVFYAMYDNNRSRVSLEKELGMLQEYFELEKMSLGDKVHITLKISGNAANEQVAPFIILPVIENAFKQLSLHDISGKRLEADIKTINGVVNINITWSKPGDTSTLHSGRGIIIQNISRRLRLIYPQSHELKVTINVHTVVVNLKINLRKAINK